MKHLYMIYIIYKFDYFLCDFILVNIITGQYKMDVKYFTDKYDRFKFITNTDNFTVYFSDVEIKNTIKLS